MTSRDPGAGTAYAPPDGVGRPPLQGQGTGGPAERVVRQITAIDAWTATRRQREHDLRTASLSRAGRLDADRHIAVLRRTHDAIKGRCAAGLEHDGGPFRTGPTAVIAHRHVWFAEKVAMELADQGVTVLVTTDNGAEALGVVVAEQPDLLLAGERLAMLTGTHLLADARSFAPQTLRALQPVEDHVADRGAADAVYPRHHAPRAVAASLVSMHLARRTCQEPPVPPR